jgi:hypothetical protein
VNQNHMSDGYVHKRTEEKHVKKCEAKHESKSEEEYENSSRYEFLTYSTHLLSILLRLKQKLIQVTCTVTKHAHKSFISWLGGFSLHISFWVE